MQPTDFLWRNTKELVGLICKLLHDNKTESPLNTYLEISNNIKTLNCIELELSKYKERKRY